jgi:hypothetical protein
METNGKLASGASEALLRHFGVYFDVTQDGGGAGAGGGEGGGSGEGEGAVKLTLDEHQTKFLQSKGIDVTKLAADPKAMISAVNLLATSRGELAQLASKRDQEIKGLNQKLIESGKPPTVVKDGEGKYDEAAIAKVMAAAGQASQMQQVADLLHSQGKIDDATFDLLTEKDPVNLRIKLNQPAAFDEKKVAELISEGIEKGVSKVLGKFGIATDVSTGQKDQQQTSGLDAFAGNADAHAETAAFVKARQAAADKAYPLVAPRI